MQKQKASMVCKIQLYLPVAKRIKLMFKIKKNPCYINYILLKFSTVRNSIKVHKIISVLFIRKTSYCESEKRCERNSTSKEFLHSLE